MGVFILEVYTGHNIYGSAHSRCVHRHNIVGSVHSRGVQRHNIYGSVPSIGVHRHNIDECIHSRVCTQVQYIDRIVHSEGVNSNAIFKSAHSR